MKHLPRFAALAAVAIACGDETNDGGGLEPPAPPTSVRAIGGFPRLGGIRIEWTDMSSDETEFAVARAVVAGASVKPDAAELSIVGSVSANTTSFVDGDVVGGRFYFYGVSARKIGAKGALVLQEGDAVSLTDVAAPCEGTPTAGDFDGDGLDDAVEEEGWTVRVDEDGRGSLTERLVKSSTLDADTDGDGLCDRDESSLKTDPRRADTDGDGLSDPEEVNRWGSSPVNVDSDGDSSGNSLFYDGAELTSFGTSPTLADTDGDGRSDFDEINQNGTNPLVAELPQPKLELVGRMDLGVDVRLANGTVVTDAVTNAFESSMSTTIEQMSSVATSQSVESSFMISTEATVGYPFSAGVSVSGSYSETVSYGRETSASWSSESRQSAQRTYETLTSNAISMNEEITGGRIAMNLEIRNEGTRTFEIGGVVITALQRSRDNPASFTSIATLSLPAEANGIVLGEGDRRGPFRAEAAIPANVALDLLANPSAIFFRTASFQLTDRSGENFEFAVGEETNNRTALITIDYGGLRPLERYRVATNVERSPDGRTAGVTMQEVMTRILGLAPEVGYETAANSSGVRVLTRVRNVESAPDGRGGAERFWVVFAAENPNSAIPPASQRILSPYRHFEDLVLMPRDAVFLAFLADADGDGLFDREEQLYGTFDDTVDSDGDGLTDFEETREGWLADVDLPFYRANPKVFSNPTLADVDGDGWDDPTERAMGTDPNRRDTDADGLIDSIDPDPTLGPRGTWVKLIGSTMDEVTHQIAASSDTLYLLGHSTGDVDGDGASNGPFVMALEPADGTTRWVVQLEGTTDYVKQLSVAADGRVTFAAELVSGVLPGVNSNALYALQWDRAGTLLAANDLTNAGNITNNYLIDRVLLWSSVATPGGTTVLMRQRLNNGEESFHRLSLDSNAAYVTAVGTWGPGVIPDLRDVSVTGNLMATSVDNGGAGCGLLFQSVADLLADSGFSYCTGIRTGRNDEVVLDRQHAVWVAVTENGRDRLDRNAFNGELLRSLPFIELGNPVITALDVDATDRVFVGLRDEGAGAPAILEILRPDTSSLATLVMGNASTQIVGTGQDGIGNLFSAGSTTGGFEAFAPSSGGSDVLLVRNPQLLFGP